MTPEEKFNQDIWWILQEIRKDEFLAPKDGKVEFLIRTQPKIRNSKTDNVSYAIPDIDTQRKLLYKLKDWKAIDVEPVDNILRGSDIFNPKIYELSIKQKKFTELYSKYENSIGYQETEAKTPVAIKNPPIIKPKTLELIAKDIGNLGTGTELIDFLTECGVDGKLIEYPQTKWRMVYAILTALSTSPKLQDQEILFKIIEEAAHPLMHKGDKKAAEQYEDKFNNLLAYDNFALKNSKLKKIEKQSELDDDGEDEDDVFSYDGGISSPYENTDLELFILKKIQLEHKRRDDSGFLAKELSFNNNSLEEICRVINKLMEDKILYLSANTRPERTEKEEGIENKDGFINWKMVERLDKAPQEMDTENGCVIFDTELLDEVKLKGRIDIAIEEFMNDKAYTPLGIMMDKAELEKILESVEHETDKKKKNAVEEALTPKRITYPYYKQRAIIIDEISKDNKEELTLPLNNFRDEKVEVLKTLLALEKENLLRVTELRSSPVYDEKGNFLGRWSAADNPVARIYTLKTQANRQEPMLLKIVEMPEVKIKGLEEKIVMQKPKNKRIQLRQFPADLKWEEISIQFLNEHEVIIKAKKETLQTTYEAMGFQDEKRKLPNKQWQFLRLLALKNGEISWENNQRLPLKQINSIKKQKQLLSEALKAFFQISESEPFHDYKKEKAYKIKITLTPEPELKEINEQDVYDE